jgi:hypothetical protein
MGWFLISIVIPIFTPLVLVGMYLLAPVEQANGQKLISQVKDGQLSWPACGFCASALYELAESRMLLDEQFSNWAQGGFTVMLLISAFIALLSVVFPTPLPLPVRPLARRQFKMLLGSVAVVGISAIFYTWLHFLVSQ